VVKHSQASRRDFQPAGHLQQHYCISQATLRRWANNGTVRCVRYGANGKRLYSVDDFQRHLGIECHSVEDRNKTESIIYARVSSVHQKEDLQRQIDDLKSVYPTHRVLSDVGSGLNFKRKGLLTLLERVLEGVVREVVVMYKDRLCRYGVQLLEFVFKKAGTQFVVHGKDEETNDTRELADDLLAITTVFVARHNGRRSAANRRRRQEEHQDTGVSH